MIKKPFTVFVIIGVLFILFLFLILKRPNGHSRQAITAIPPDAVLVLRANGITELCSSLMSSNYWQNLPANSFKKDFEDFVASIDSLGSDLYNINKILIDSTLYVSLHQNDNKTLGVLFYLPFGTSVNNEILAAKLYLFFSKEGFKFIKFNPVTNNTGTNQMSNQVPLYYFFDKGLLIIGNNIKNLSEAYLQINNKKTLLSDTCFTKVYVTTGKKVAGNLFINMQKISAVFDPLIQKDYYDSFQKTLKTKGWVALDLNIERSYISLHGFSVADASKQIWLKAFKNEQPVENMFNKVLPASTAFYAAYTFNDPYSYKLAYNADVHNNMRLSEKLKKIRQLSGSNVDEKLFNIMAEAAAMVISHKKGGAQNVYFITKTGSNIQALDYINLFRKNKQGLINHGKFKSILNNDTLFDKVTFQKLPCTNLPSVLFGEATGYGNYSYICNYKEYLLFGSSEESLRDYITEITDNKNIICDTLYQEVMSDLLSSKANISLYFRIPSVWNFLNTAFSPELSEKIGSYMFNVKANSVLGIQVSGNGQFYYNNIFLYSEAREYNGPEIVWTAITDTSLDITPILLPGSSEDKNQYLVQDKLSNIYLVTSTGKIMWKQYLGEKILGKAFLIDYYKNNKQQILFNTAEKLYLIDKKGRSLKGFPLKFKSSATNGVTVTDFDGNKNYRLYLAFANKAFACLSKDGKKVDGWKFNKSSAKVTGLTQVFTFRDKDYILFSDSSCIYLLNRKGEQRLKLNKNICLSTNNQIVVDIKPDFFRLLATDTSGQVLIVYPDGHIETKNPGKFSGKHYFDYEDIDGDGVKDYLFTDGNSINVYNQDNKNIFRTQLSDAVLHKPLVVRSKHENADIYISLITADKVIMIDKRGKIVKGFPINGNFPMNVISLADDNYSFAILTGIGNKLCCYYIR